jgi:pimeloyl-ACP methyl ester carboxylesterase
VEQSNPFNQGRRQCTTILPAGRTLAWSEWGPEDGRPLLFCTGAGMSGSLGFGLELLDSLNLRLLAVDRPGLGRSSPDPTKGLDSWVKDIRQLMRHLKVADVLALGFSQGAPFAYALAAAGLVSKLGIVAGQDDFSHCRLSELGQVAEMVRAAESDPAGFEMWIESTASPTWLWSLILDMSSTRDRGLYLKPDFAAAYQACLSEGFVQGPKGYAQDTRIALSKWPFELEEIRTPVSLWYGLQDTSPVHSPDFGELQSKRLPHAELHQLQDEGGSVLWTHSKPILNELLNPSR